MTPTLFTPELVPSVFLLGVLVGFVVASIPMAYVLARVAFADVPRASPTPLDDGQLRAMLAQERELQRLEELDHHLQPFGLRVLKTRERQ